MATEGDDSAMAGRYVSLGVRLWNVNAGSATGSHLHAVGILVGTVNMRAATTDDVIGAAFASAAVVKRDEEVEPLASFENKRGLNGGIAGLIVRE